MKVNGQWIPCMLNSSYSFMPIALKLYVCYGHVLKICMWLGYNPRIIFVLFFFNNLNCHFFGHFSESIEGTLCAQLLVQFNNNTFETLHCDHALKICMCLGYTPQINFCHFFYNLNYVIWTFSHLESDLPAGGIVFHKYIF